MALVDRMLAASPVARAGGSDVVAAAIVACQDGAQAATACADACIGEESVDELTDCIRALLNAADICTSTAKVLSRTVTEPSVIRAVLAATWTAARYAREQCQEHMPIHHHCDICAQACRAVEVSCRELLEDMS